MNETTILDQFDDVTDSTDWLTTPLSGLAAVEASLRCQVCKDFYKTPMLTSCNHTFCSICIRRALSNDGKCPLCRTSEQEVKLRSNWSLEEVVTAFTKTRPDVLLFAKRKPDNIVVELSKRKLEERDDMYSAGQPDGGRGKRLRSSARLSKSRSMGATSEMARLEIDMPDQEDSTDFEPDDGLVECPICLQRMKHTLVDRHIDTSCPGQPQPQQKTPKQNPRSLSTLNVFPSSTISPLAKTYERLPAINYSMLKEPQLKKKLLELGISSAGNRLILEKRHREWMTIWNANCDSLQPRRRAELLRDLDIWERTLGSRAPTTSKALSLGAQIKDKDFDGAAWAVKHDTSFKNLVASARQNKVRAGQISHTKNGGAEGEQETGEYRNGEGGNGDGEAEPAPQADTEMLASMNDSPAEEPRELVDRVRLAQASGIIDLTGDVASSSPSGTAMLLDEEGGRVDVDSQSRTMAIYKL
ncbi:DNA repair protein rad18 [Hypoxylon rubiginosum]|uniref:DNA repair protein rad18 n=1 Tax=Hypoxylon rubiginosum TaxID=110542 RepID=A0ACB9Z9J8_9PEZI|nr:DNA repair protein rad18 [Hypoxylon rubiginosum]